MNPSSRIHVNHSEVNLSEVLKSFKLYFDVLKINFLIIFLSGLFFTFIGVYIAHTIKPKYKAELRFIVKSEGSGSSFSGMLGGLGNLLGGNSMGSPLEKTIEIASSDRIVGSALLSTVNFNGKNEILANCLIQAEDLHKTWEGDEVLRGMKFLKVDSSIERMPISKRMAIKKLETLLIPKSGEGIVSKSFDKKSGVVTLSATHTNEDFAIVLAKEIYNKLRDFYVEQMITSAANNVLVLQKKVDSIKYELSRVQSKYAQTTDQSFGLLFQEDKVELRKLAVREQMLLAMYAEAQKNLEGFKFMNDSAVPSLTVIDMPYSPLMKLELNKLLVGISGFIFGSFLVFILCIFRSRHRFIGSTN
jgi:capsular polysaccharide biosynthesis protein